MCRLFRGACRDACLTGLETALAGLAGGRATLVLVALHLLTGHVSPSVLVLHRTLLRPRPCGRSGDRAALRRRGEFLLDPRPWCSRKRSACPGRPPTRACSAFRAGVYLRSDAGSTRTDRATASPLLHLHRLPRRHSACPATVRAVPSQLPSMRPPIG